MFRKRLLAFGLAGVMVMGLNMSVLASNIVTQESDPKTATSTVEGVVPPKYTIEVPAKLDDTGDSKEVTAKDLNLEINGTLVVTMNVPTVKLKLDGSTEEGPTNSYTVSIANTTNDISTTNPVLSIGKSDQSIPAKLKAAIHTNVGTAKLDTLEAGTYTGTATFDISYTITT